MNFHEYLKSLMKNQFLTQKAIADLLEMDKSYFSKMVNGRLEHLPSADTVQALTEILQCTIDERIELFRLAGKIPPELRMAFFSSAQDAKEIYSFVFSASK